MPNYPGDSDECPEHTFFDEAFPRRPDRAGHARQQVVSCEKCYRLDSIFFGGGVPLSAKCCVYCGGALVTMRSKSAKLRVYDAVIDRGVALVVAAANGTADVDQAVAYAEYVAHGLFVLRLVPYGPEPEQ